MFGKNEVNEVMNWLEKNVPFFASEAQLQMSFIAGAMDLFSTKRYIFIPEYTVEREKFNGKKCDKRDEIDLVIVDNKDNGKKTFIEFKHKTFGYEGDVKKGIDPFIVPLSYKNRIIDPKFEPTNMGAVDLGSYDCWSDIERLQYYKNMQQECDNAFFIFITNDERYWKSNATGRTHKFSGFSIADGDRCQKNRNWEYTDPAKTPVKGTAAEKRSIGSERIKHVPLVTNDYDRDSAGNIIKFEDFGKQVNYSGKSNLINFRQYKKLVLEIK